MKKIKNILEECLLSLSSGLLLSHRFSKNIALIPCVVLFGCGTWSLTLREKLRLRVFENRELRVIFGCEREEVTRGWRKVNNEELHNLFSFPNVRIII
jgi:hypothetical protein